MSSTETPEFEGGYRPDKESGHKAIKAGEDHYRELNEQTASEFYKSLSPEGSYSPEYLKFLDKAEPKHYQALREKLFSIDIEEGEGAEEFLNLAFEIKNFNPEEFNSAEIPASKWLTLLNYISYLREQKKWYDYIEYAYKAQIINPNLATKIGKIGAADLQGVVEVLNYFKNTSNAVNRFALMYFRAKHLYPEIESLAPLGTQEISRLEDPNSIMNPEALSARHALLNEHGKKLKVSKKDLVGYYKILNEALGNYENFKTKDVSFLVNFISYGAALKYLEIEPVPEKK